MPSITYSPAVADLISNAPVNELGPGRTNSVKRKALLQLTPEKVAAPHAITDQEMMQACLAGLWLRHDFLHESHEISQEINTTTGSYWHAIMHRREPDFGNSKYWWRRVGQHPVFNDLHAAAREEASRARGVKQAAELVEQEAWEPYRFVDLCEAALDGDAALQELCMAVQMREWELLFDFCYRQAIATA
jgi:hypothetical protein